MCLFRMNRLVSRCSLVYIMMKAQYIPRWKRRVKEVLWRLILRLMGVRKQDFENARLFGDPKDELLQHMEEKRRAKETFTSMHLFAHMEGIRHTVPLKEYEQHREWVFNEYSHLVPSIANLLGTIAGWLLRKIILVTLTRGVAAL